MQHYNTPPLSQDTKQTVRELYHSIVKVCQLNKPLVISHLMRKASEALSKQEFYSLMGLILKKIVTDRTVPDTATLYFIRILVLGGEEDDDTMRNSLKKSQIPRIEWKNIFEIVCEAGNIPVLRLLLLFYDITYFRGNDIRDLLKKIVTDSRVQVLLFLDEVYSTEMSTKDTVTFSLSHCCVVQEEPVVQEIHPAISFSKERDKSVFLGYYKLYILTISIDLKNLRLIDFITPYFTTVVLQLPTLESPDSSPPTHDVKRDSISHSPAYFKKGMEVLIRRTIYEIAEGVDSGCGVTGTAMRSHLFIQAMYSKTKPWSSETTELNEELECRWLQIFSTRGLFSQSDQSTVTALLLSGFPVVYSTLFHIVIQSLDTERAFSVYNHRKDLRPFFYLNGSEMRDISNKIVEAVSGHINHIDVVKDIVMGYF